MARIVEEVKPSKSSDKIATLPASSKKTKAVKEKPSKKVPKQKKEKVSKKEKAPKEKAPKEKKASPHRGRTTGLRLKQAWAKVFEENAKSPSTKRMTDEQIHKFMKTEFPNKKARTLRDVGGVYVARKRFNVGKFTKGQIPSTPSTAYDEKGKAVEGKPSRKGGGDEEGRRKGFPNKTGGRKPRSVRG